MEDGLLQLFSFPFALTAKLPILIILIRIAINIEKRKSSGDLAKDLFPRTLLFIFNVVTYRLVQFIRINKWQIPFQ